jgi:hypothetical protein
MDNFQVGQICMIKHRMIRTRRIHIRYDMYHDLCNASDVFACVVEPYVTWQQFGYPQNNPAWDRDAYNDNRYRVVLYADKLIAVHVDDLRHHDEN